MVLDCRSAVPPAIAPANTAPEARASSIGNGSLLGVANDSSGYVRPLPAPQGAWASGNGTMADILKAQAAPPSFQALSATMPSAGCSDTQVSVSLCYPETAVFVESSDASEFYSSCADPVLHSSVDSRSGSAQGAIGTVGNQRLIGDRLVSTSSVEMNLGAGPVQPVSVEPNAVPGAGGAAAAAAELREAEAQLEVAAVRPASPAFLISPVCSEDLSVEEAGASSDGGSAQTPQAGGQSSPESKAILGIQYNGQPLYPSPLQVVGVQKGTRWE